MRIPELLDLINQLVKSTELEKKERISLASNIKKQYRITMRDFKYSGKEISIKTLKSLIIPLIENYGSIKDLNSINETIQIMVQDYDIEIQEHQLMVCQVSIFQK